MTVDDAALAGLVVDGTTRQSFILRGAIATAATLGIGAVTPFVSGALAAGASASSDIEILNFALAIEYLQQNLYTVKAKTVGLGGVPASYASKIGREENRHVNVLKAAIAGLGGRPAAAPSFSFPASTAGGFLALAYTVENLGVGAYNGLLPNVQNPAMLALAAGIVQVEARHAATLGILANKPVTPNGAFDTPLSTAQVLAGTRALTAAPAAATQTSTVSGG